MRNQKKSKLRGESRIDRLLEMPKEISSNIPKVTMIGFDQILVENYKAILEYQDFYIRLSTVLGIININGFSLDLKEMTTEDLVIHGKIESIDFESITDDE